MKMCGKGKGNRRSGVTALEVSLAVTLMVIFGGSAVTLGRSLSRAFGSQSGVAQRDVDLHQALDRIVSRLRTADGQAVLPAGINAPFHSTWIEFQRATGHDGNAVTWGVTERIQFEYDATEADDGVDNDGDGLVDEGRAVWIVDAGGPNQRRVVLASPVPEFHVNEVPGNGIDDDGNGLEDEGGLAFEITGDRMRIVLSLDSFDSEGNLQSTSAERVVVMRNTGVNAP